MVESPWKEYIERLEIHLDRLKENDLQTAVDVLQKCPQTSFPEIRIIENPSNAQVDLSKLLRVCTEKATRLSFQDVHAEFPSSAFNLK
jgi:hypothetical protein